MGSGAGAGGKGGGGGERGLQQSRPNPFHFFEPCEPWVLRIGQPKQPLLAHRTATKSTNTSSITQAFIFLHRQGCTTDLLQVSHMITPDPL